MILILLCSLVDSNQPIFQIHKRHLIVPKIKPGFRIHFQKAEFSNSWVNDQVEYQVFGNEAFVIEDKLVPIVTFKHHIPNIDKYHIHLQIVAINSQHPSYWSYMHVKLTFRKKDPADEYFDIVYTTRPQFDAAVTSTHGEHSTYTLSKTQNYYVTSGGIVKVKNPNMITNDIFYVQRTDSTKVTNIMIRVEMFVQKIVTMEWNTPLSYTIDEWKNHVGDLCVNCKKNTNTRVHCSTNTAIVSINPKKNNLFSLNVVNLGKITNGIIFNVTCGQISVYECYDSWTIGRPVVLKTITLDKNKNGHVTVNNRQAPSFVNQSCGVFVRKHSPPGTKLFKVTAEDQDFAIDGEVNYKITGAINLADASGECGPPNIESFSIGDGGEVFAAKQLHGNTNYIVKIRAHDMSPQKLRGEIRCLLRVIEIPEVFNYKNDQGSFFTNDDVDPADIKSNWTMTNTITAKSPHVDDITYSLSGSASKHFSIDQETGTVTLTEQISTKDDVNMTLTISAFSLKYPSFESSFSLAITHHTNKLSTMNMMWMIGTGALTMIVLCVAAYVCIKKTAQFKGGDKYASSIYSC